MSRRGVHQSGQATVEFALFAVALVLALVLIIQITWIGVQKWQFNHFANYAARVWSVRQDDTQMKSMLRVLGAGLMSWDTARRDYVKFIWVSKSKDTKTLHNGHENVTADGISYIGVAPLMPLFRPFIGSSSFINNPIPPQVLSLFKVSPPKVGVVRFAVFVPITKEPKERPKAGGQKFDNDCRKTPCDKGNKR